MLMQSNGLKIRKIQLDRPCKWDATTRGGGLMRQLIDRPYMHSSSSKIRARQRDNTRGVQKKINSLNQRKYWLWLFVMRSTMKKTISHQKTTEMCYVMYLVLESTLGRERSENISEIGTFEQRKECLCVPWLKIKEGGKVGSYWEKINRPPPSVDIKYCCALLFFWKKYSLLRLFFQFNTRALVPFHPFFLFSLHRCCWRAIPDLYFELPSHLLLNNKMGKKKRNNDSNDISIKIRSSVVLLALEKWERDQVCNKDIWNIKI